MTAMVWLWLKGLILCFNIIEENKLKIIIKFNWSLNSIIFNYIFKVCMYVS